MSACSVCPFSNLSYTRKLPPRVTAIFLLFLMFDFLLLLFIVGSCQTNPHPDCFDKTRSEGFCREVLSFCARSLSKNRCGELQVNFSSLPTAPTVGISNLAKPAYFTLFVGFYSSSIWEGLRWRSAIRGQRHTTSHRFLAVAHLKALRVSASTHKHLLCAPVRSAARVCLENPPTSAASGSYPLLAKYMFWISL